MNTKNVYEAEILRITSRKYNISTGKFRFTFEYAKKTLIYINEKGHYLDLRTNERYLEHRRLEYGDVGDLYISLIYPLSNIIETTEDMSKRKILRKYNKYRKQGR